MMSSKVVGLSRTIRARMPSLSNWKTPAVLAAWSRWKVGGIVQGDGVDVESLSVVLADEAAPPGR